MYWLYRCKNCSNWGQKLAMPHSNTARVQNVNKLRADSSSAGIFPLWTTFSCIDNGLGRVVALAVQQLTYLETKWI